MKTNDNAYWRYILKRLLFISVVFYLVAAKNDIKKGMRDGYYGTAKARTSLKKISAKANATSLIGTASFFSLKSF